jgi:hypothetical protein
MSGALVPGDFKLFFIRGRGTATGATILSVAHTAGDSTLTLTLDITGTPNGNETVEFRAFPGEIFNASGEAASSSTTTGKLELNDRILTSLEGTLEEKQVVIRNNIINSKRGEEARITYNVERSTRVTISIHDLNGDLIKVLFDGTSMPGLNEVLWAGENKKGRSVVGGVYYIVIKIGDTRDVKKILVAW